MQMANANLNPFTEAKLDVRNPQRGPLLIIQGERDHTVAPAIGNASYKRQRHNEAVTEIQKIPNRGHSLTIDGGWQEVAQAALDFVKRFADGRGENVAPDSGEGLRDDEPGDAGQDSK
jgi:pimeloyl-ACP methyl ester carboxylesterase